MGLRFRKSVEKGPFRLNFSKSGVGYSFGNKFFRVTKKATGGARTTATLPGTGISYVKDFSGTSQNKTTAKENCGLGNGKKPFYKKWWVWLIVALVLASPFLAQNNAQDSTPPSSDAAASALESESTLQKDSQEETDPAEPSDPPEEEEKQDEAVPEEEPAQQPQDTEPQAEPQKLTEEQAPQAEQPSQSEDTQPSGQQPGGTQSSSRQPGDTQSSDQQPGETQPLGQQSGETQSSDQQPGETQPSGQQGEGAESMPPSDTAQTNSQMVWIPKSGTKYHSSPNCSGMENPTQVSIEEARALGFTPCKKCY